MTQAKLWDELITLGVEVYCQRGDPDELRAILHRWPHLEPQIRQAVQDEITMQLTSPEGDEQYRKAQLLMAEAGSPMAEGAFPASPAQIAELCEEAMAHIKGEEIRDEISHR